MRRRVIPGCKERGILATLARASKELHLESDTVARAAPEEHAHIPMLERGVTIHFLRCVVTELHALGRGDYDSGRFLNGGHTTSSENDYLEFSRVRYEYCGKACTLHSGMSFVETCVAVGITHDPATGLPFFGPISVFVSYTWRGEGI